MKTLLLTLVSIATFCTALAMPLSIRRQLSVLISSSLLGVGVPVNAQILNSDETVVALTKDINELGMRLRNIIYRGSVRVSERESE